MASRLWGIFPFGDRKLSCQKFQQISSEYLEGALSPKKLWEFNYHAERCNGCGTFVSSLRATVRTLNSLPPRNAPEELKQRLLEQCSGKDSDTSSRN